jgi:hypothetical protein
LLRDVTKTKESHHRPTNRAVTAPKIDAPTTAGGTTLANEVTQSRLSDEVKARLIREIIDYEASHGTCTQTFTRKIRKQVRGSGT